MVFSDPIATYRPQVFPACDICTLHRRIFFADAGLYALFIKFAGNPGNRMPYLELYSKHESSRCNFAGFKTHSVGENATRPVNSNYDCHNDFYCRGNFRLQHGNSAVQNLREMDERLFMFFVSPLGGLCVAIGFDTKGEKLGHKEHKGNLWHPHELFGYFRRFSV